MKKPKNHDPPGWLIALVWGVLIVFWLGGKEADKSDVVSASVLSASFAPIEEEDDENKPDYIPPANRSFTMSCAVGSDPLGLHNGYVRGKVVRMRLCALPIYSSSEESTPGKRFYVRGASKRALVSAPASYDYVRLLGAARKAGIRLSATSSFRTYPHQVELWKALGGNRAVVAPPGFSNHQQGAAIDFAFSGVNNTVRNCNWRGGICTIGGHPTWDWLNANSRKHGIRQYYGEFWHFSPSGG